MIRLSGSILTLTASLLLITLPAMGQGLSPDTWSVRDTLRGERLPEEALILTAFAQTERFQGVPNRGVRRKIPVSPGNGIEIRAMSDDFDPVLYVLLPTGEVIYNDDYGISTNPGIRTVVPAGVDSLEVLVSSFDARGQGVFTLSATMTSLIRSMEKPGTLGPKSRITPKLERFEPCTYEATGHSRLTIDLVSEEFDPYLVATSPRGIRYSNDDTNGLNSVLEILDAEPGRWAIVVTSGERQAEGQYRLVITEEPLETMGTSRTGRLEQGDSVSIHGEYYDVHTVGWETGTPLSILAESADFDVYISVELPDGERIAGEDRMTRGERRFAASLFLPQAPPSLRLYVTSYGEGETGEYRVRMGTERDPIKR